MTRPLAAPEISRKVPRLELVDIPATVAVPLAMRVPLANGVPAMGRTRTFCQVSLHTTPPRLVLVTVKIIWVAVTEVIATDVALETPLMLLIAFPPPLTLSILTVGALPPVSKRKPDGTFRIIVPVPTLA